MYTACRIRTSYFMTEMCKFGFTDRGVRRYIQRGKTQEDCELVYVEI